MSEASDGAAAQMGLRTRAGHFGRVLIDAALRREEIVGVTADLSKYTDMAAFAERFPARFVNVGMAEQNLVMVSAGLAQAGLVPVATTFAAFLTRRAQDFTLMQIVLARANVKLIGAVPGITASFGPSHASTDDLATMLAAPGLVVLDPADGEDLAQATAAALEHDGPVYIRQLFDRPGSDERLQLSSEPFAIGKARLLREGKEVGIVASGMMIDEALAAADLLAGQGISAAVLHAGSLKPFDEDALLALASRCRGLVTAENHSVVGGLFSTVAGLLARRGGRVPVVPIGIPDRFPQFGSLPFLKERLGMRALDIAAAAAGLVDHR